MSSKQGFCPGVHHTLQGMYQQLRDVHTLGKRLRASPFFVALPMNCGLMWRRNTKKKGSYGMYQQPCEPLKLACSLGDWWRATNGILQGCPPSVIRINTCMGFGRLKLTAYGRRWSWMLEPSRLSVCVTRSTRSTSCWRGGGGGEHTTTLEDTPTT